MIIDEKVIMYPPPPPYGLILSTLPSHLLLQIVYLTFPHGPGLVNRAFYIACMHVLRSTYLPSYNLQLRPPYTSDPFPTSSSDPCLPSYSPTPTTSHFVLDKYIALKVREDVFQDDRCFPDLFELMQPKSRLEDLVRLYGVREGVVTLSSGGSSRSSPVHSRNGSTTTLPSPSTPTPRSGLSSRATAFFSSLKSSSKSSGSKPPPSPSQNWAPQITPLTFSISLVGLVLASSQGQRRTIVEVQREGRRSG
ncbi:hypothetical protein BDQ17DRAFT_1351357 [Cyathus striatus]|nr:hypothetical protein BDQ17DRAFT_1351357 [Cyathus striatus]